MKIIKTCCILILGVILGSVVASFIFQHNLTQKPQSQTATDTDLFGDSFILPFQDSFLSGNYGNEALFITFQEDFFTIKAGEEFHYCQAVKSYEGELMEVMQDAVKREYEEGLYVIRYRVYDKEDKDSYRQYVKLLHVIQ